MIKLPSDVAKIIQILEKAGFEAYAVGGCVRDSILGKEPNDWDITTNALPEQVKENFSHTIDTGIQHGTVTVMMHHVGYEVTTYRVDGEYEDSRHPKNVTFTACLEEDLKRRDFTINAMAYNEKDGLVDVFGGRDDLQKGVIRAVGDPKERFTEDALRMMRAVRFAAQLGYSIEENTLAAIREMAPTLRKISAERIQTELVKLLVSDHPEHMCLLYKAGITAVIMPQFDRMMETTQNNPHHCYTVGMHSVHAMENVRADKVLRLTMLFHDMGKPDTKTTGEDGIDHFHGHAKQSEAYAKEILKKLKFDNDTLHKTVKLTFWHDHKIHPNPKSVRRALNAVGEELFLLLLEVKEADTMAQSMYLREDKLQELKQLRTTYEQIIEKEECFSLKDLSVSGQDLIALGMKPGPQIGDMLGQLLDLVLEDPAQNTKENLLSVASKSIF
ncbi:MAG: CCA tRNA nucleotidyltransferase [Lachnospiraceae bacterium]|nr:CCA tRNA nucleotidyltransferase [Lachnospiraceae bacterium]